MILKIQKGPLAGATNILINGGSLGREGASWNLEDPKISEIHAYIHCDSSGNWYIKDNDSKNGILSGEKKVLKLLLEDDVEFLLGNTLVVVKKVPKKATITDPEDKSPKTPTLRSEAFKTLQSFITEGLDQLQDTPRDVGPFPCSLELRFLKGVQMGTRWSLGYGPREIGCTEFPILEPNSPKPCFELAYRNGKFEFLTQHPNSIKVSGKSLPSTYLVHGDRIEIGNTMIEVNFDQNGKN